MCGVQPLCTALHFAAALSHLSPRAHHFFTLPDRPQLAFSRSAGRLRRYTATPKAQLQKLEGAFCAAVEAHIPKSGEGMTFASAWLATDNIVVHLLHKCVGGARRASDDAIRAAF